MSSWPNGLHGCVRVFRRHADDTDLADSCRLVAEFRAWRNPSGGRSKDAVRYSAMTRSSNKRHVKGKSEITHWLSKPQKPASGEQGICLFTACCSGGPAVDPAWIRTHWLRWRRRCLRRRRSESKGRRTES